MNFWSESYEVQREFTIVLSDWTFEDPHRILANLKRYGGYYNCQSPGSWGQRRAFSPASWDHLIARVMGPPAWVPDPFSPGSWGQPIARVMGPPHPALG